MWQSLAYSDRKKLPCSSGIYRIEGEGVCFYVGSAFNLWSRIVPHSQKKVFEALKADTILYRLVAYEDLGIEELRSIVEFKPVLNKYRQASPKRSTQQRKKSMAKTAILTSRLLLRTKELLKTRPDILTYEQIQNDTGITIAWLTSFASKDGTDSSVGRIEALYEYLSGRKLDIA